LSEDSQIAESEHNPLEESKQDTYRLVTNDSVIEDRTPLKGRDNAANNIFHRNNDNVLFEESKNTNNKRNLNYFLSDNSEIPTLLQADSIKQEKKSPNNEFKESENNMANFVKYRPKQMFPDFNIRENKFAKIESFRGNANTIDEKTEYVNTPLFKRAETVLHPDNKLGSFNENIIEEARTNRLISLEDQEIKKVPDLLFEKSLIESHELIEELENNKNTIEKAKLRKLKSKKLRRKRKINKIKLTDALNFFNKK